MKVRLPNFFSIQQATDLVRIGRDYDGGYLVSKSDIEKTDVLVGLGISDDWSFEEDFLSRKIVPVLAYDASVSDRFFRRNFFKSLRYIYNPKLIHKRLVTWLSYRKFFYKPNVQHIQKFVGLNSIDNIHCTFADVLNETNNENIFLKIDVEGSEYRFLQDIIANEERITGMVIELHDVDIHLDKIEEFFNKFSLNLVHVHANNYAPISAYGDLPLVLELTFSKYSNNSTECKLPHNLDMPNNKNCSEYEILVNGP